ncbi:Mu transposase C-terminal domain-containing protein [Rhizobium sp. PL01]|uniref:Mu transposase C-terminal domain-containing protein n=1 Tax=Rhizobium sp. PL01 TaxID=3085631 RepID=UPI0029819E99|nr:Mu transposase C-terminal domain-containing protein [Rhizobium sp. PL01]MDW5318343.1 Mu transposase C-terminal domain-containing protein [Rhizobium sp. PL01]
MNKRPDKMVATEVAWTKAVTREALIRPLATAKRIPAVGLARVCRELGLKRSRLYELIALYRAAPVASSLLDGVAGQEKGGRRLRDDVEETIEVAIRDTYRSRERPTAKALHDRVRQLCHEAGIPAPSLKAVRGRVDQADQKALYRDREGATAARQRFAPVVQEYTADYAFQVVQIDHTLVDLFIVDSVHRRPLQRPWLTLAIDIASRMVAGFHVSLESPSSTSVALVVQQLVLPKEPWLEDRRIEADWPAHGLPDIIHLDNAREFHGKALIRGAAEHGISLVHRPVRRPHYGAHIERLIGTMMGAVHMLPGSTSSNVADRGSYDSEKHAAMTLDELERWLTLEITGRYHADLHRRLGVPPRLAWDDGLADRPYPLRLPHDPGQFLIDFLPFEERFVRRDGIHLFGFRYWDDVLSPWAGRGQRVRVKYDPRDLSRVQVEGADGFVWTVHFADLRRPRITLGEHRLAMAALRARGVRAVNEELIFSTIAEQRQLLADAAVKTRTVRRNAERSERALFASRDCDALPDDQPVPELFEDLPPLSVEEWS